jgi:hypothetical protein
MTMKRALVVSLALLPGAVRADDVFLTGGGRISGVIVERTAGSITLDVGPGRVTLPMTRVNRVVARTGDLTVYRQRAEQLLPENVAGWVALARWAEDHDLLTQAREAYAYVLTLDADNAAAHRGLGHVWTGERWGTLEESYLARGYVPFEGSWVTPDERRAMVEERMAWAAAERDRVEASARAREAEARARVAEAEARRAEAVPPPGSIPLDMAYGYGGYGYGGGGGYYGGGYGGYGPIYDPYAPGMSNLPPPVVVEVPVPPPQRGHGFRPHPAPQPQPAGGARVGVGASRRHP